VLHRPVEPAERSGHWAGFYECTALAASAVPVFDHWRRRRCFRVQMPFEKRIQASRTAALSLRATLFKSPSRISASRSVGRTSIPRKTISLCFRLLDSATRWLPVNGVGLAATACGSVILMSLRSIGVLLQRWSLHFVGSRGDLQEGSGSAPAWWHSTNTHEPARCSVAEAAAHHLRRGRCRGGRQQVQEVYVSVSSASTPAAAISGFRRRQLLASWAVAERFVIVPGTPAPPASAPAGARCRGRPRRRRRPLAQAARRRAAKVDFSRRSSGRCAISTRASARVVSVVTAGMTIVCGNGRDQSGHRCMMLLADYRGK
jgi:hypothetical protein